MQIIQLRIVHSFKQPFLVLHLVNSILPGDFLAGESEIETILLILGNLIATQCIDPHFTSAILAFWNFAVKLEVLNRMVFRLHRQAFYTRKRWQALGYSPRPQYAVLFEAQIIMQSRSMVTVNDES